MLDGHTPLSEYRFRTLWSEGILPIPVCFRYRSISGMLYYKHWVVLFIHLFYNQKGPNLGNMSLYCFWLFPFKNKWSIFSGSKYHVTYQTIKSIWLRDVILHSLLILCVTGSIAGVMFTHLFPCMICASINKKTVFLGWSWQSSPVLGFISPLKLLDRGYITPDMCGSAVSPALSNTGHIVFVVITDPVTICWSMAVTSPIFILANAVMCPEAYTVQYLIGGLL